MSTGKEQTNQIHEYRCLSNFFKWKQDNRTIKNDKIEFFWILQNVCNGTNIEHTKNENVLKVRSIYI